MSALLGGRSLTPASPTVDWMSKLPTDLGVMKNDVLGCCLIAGMYHAIQLWTANTKSIETNPDSLVLSTYEEFCGYDPKNPDSDQGGVEQDVLKNWMNKGIPTFEPLDTQDTLNKISAFYEVDPRHLDDVHRTIEDCGVSYIGVQMPVYVLQNPTKIWDEPGTGDDASIEGGHCVIQGAHSFLTKLFGHISWGMKLQMTEGFFQRYTDEVYGPVNPDWINAQGTAPCGLSLGELEAQMGALKIS